MTIPAARSAVAATLVVLFAWLAGQTPALAAPLDFTMHAQQKTNWCWAAAGVSIAGHHGHPVTQNQFCALSKNLGSTGDCPNNQANLAEVQRGFSRLGFRNAGTYVHDHLTYSAIQGQLNANRPVETRIGWKSGGGHMHVLYGFDSSKSWVYWGDPWPSSYRYNWATYSYYVNNSSFAWTHTLTGIQR